MTHNLRHHIRTPALRLTILAIIIAIVLSIGWFLHSPDIITPAPLPYTPSSMLVPTPTPTATATSRPKATSRSAHRLYVQRATRLHAALVRKRASLASKAKHRVQPHGYGVVAFGRMLQARGFRVSEHPLFGGVNPVHSTNSAHYSNNAIDVNHDQGNEVGAINSIVGLAASYGLTYLWQVEGHYNHGHFETKH